jgi:hypothetical protein
MQYVTCVIMLDVFPASHVVYNTWVMRIDLFQVIITLAFSIHHLPLVIQA